MKASLTGVPAKIHHSLLAQEWKKVRGTDTLCWDEESWNSQKRKQIMWKRTRIYEITVEASNPLSDDGTPLSKRRFGNSNLRINHSDHSVFRYVLAYSRWRDPMAALVMLATIHLIIKIQDQRRGLRLWSGAQFSRLLFMIYLEIIDSSRSFAAIWITKSCDFSVMYRQQEGQNIF